MKKAIYILALVAVVATGCYDNQIDKIREEIELLKDGNVASLAAQVDSMMSSVGRLNNLSTETGSYVQRLNEMSESLQRDIANIDQQLGTIESTFNQELSDVESGLIDEFTAVRDALQSRLDAVNAMLADLEKTRVSLNAKIDSLRNFAADSYVTQDWIKGTYATLQSQNAIVEDVEKIKADVETMQSSIAVTKEAIEKQLETVIASLTSELSSELQAKASELSTFITNTVEKAYDELSDDHTVEFFYTITASEEALMNWIYNELTAYLTASEAQARIEAFNAIAGTVPDGKNLQQEIEDMQSHIDSIKQNVVKEYQGAIETAIKNSHDGIATIIGEEIGKVNATVKDFTSRIDDLESKISQLQTDFEKLQSRVNTLEEQGQAISTSVSRLDSLYQILQDYIKQIEQQLKQTDTTQYDGLKELIDNLQQYANDSLMTRIDDLIKYVGTIPNTTISSDTSIVKWILKTKETYEQQFATYCTITHIASEQGRIESKLAADTASIVAIQARLDSIILNSEATVKGWINTKLAAHFGYGGTEYNITKFDDLLSSLEEDLLDALSKGDSKIEAGIESTRELVGKVKDELNTEIESAIEEAIGENSGFVTKAIEDKIKEHQQNIDSLKSKVSGLESDLNDVKNKVAAVRDSVNLMKSRVDELATFAADFGFDNLAELVGSVMDTLNKCPNRFATIDSVQAYLKKLYGDGGTLENPKEGSIQYWYNQLKGLIDRLETAEGSLDLIEKYLAGYYKDGAYTTTFSDLRNEIDKKLSNLDTLINQEGGLLDVYKAITDALYGEGGSKDSPKDSTIWYLIKNLEKDVVSTCFSSVAWIPADGSGATTINDLAFVVRPAALAAILAESGACSILYTTTNTKAANTVYEWKGCKFKCTGDDVKNGIIRYDSVQSSSVPSSLSGDNIYIALKVDLQYSPYWGGENKQGVSFTSQFIRLK